MYFKILQRTSWYNHPESGNADRTLCPILKANQSPVGGNGQSEFVQSCDLAAVFLLAHL